MALLANKGKPWTPEEFNTLLSELREKKAFKELAAAHGRTVNAIKFKAFGYACDQVLDEGKSEKEVAEELGLLQKELEKEVNRRLPKLVSVNEPVVEKKSLVVVKKPLVRTLPDDVAEIWSTVNTLQSLVHKYMNKLSSK
jgi:poly(A) polymerase Pap1